MILKDERGFTLIELLAVISITAVVLLAIASAQFNWFDNTVNLPKQNLNQEQIRFAFEQIVSDIEEADTDKIILETDSESGNTTSLNLTNHSDSSYIVTYQYNLDSKILSVDKDSNNIILARNIISFVVEEVSGTYYIEGEIEDLDNRPYKLVTSARPIIW